jgi:peptide chain release factor 1
MNKDELLAQIYEIDFKISEAEKLLADPEISVLAHEEINTLKQQKEELEKHVDVSQFENRYEEKPEAGSSLDTRNAIIEVKGAAGGDEASIFARELLRMYIRYCERHGISKEMIDENSIKVMSRNAFGIFKFESGVHRVQRVPLTEKRGRVHTSTAVVSILPELKDVDLHIGPNDIEFEAYRSGGHGGQNVNKVSTAVRLKHIPSGIVVTAQTERSQIQNRENAMSLLRAKLWEQEVEKQHQEIAELKSTQVGRGMRNEKIRTYNFPQDRVTDHRIGKSYHNLPTFMDGEIDEMLSDLKKAESEPTPSESLSPVQE